MPSLVVTPVCFLLLTQSDDCSVSRSVNCSKCHWTGQHVKDKIYSHLHATGHPPLSDKLKSSSSIAPAPLATHLSLPPRLPSGTSETPGRRQPIQWPITPLIAYQIQFGIAVNEAKYLHCGSESVCAMCFCVCEAPRSVLPLSSPISGTETSNCPAPTRLPSKTFLLFA